MILGLTLALLCTFCLGTLEYVADNTIFITLSLALRFIQGIGCITMRILSTPIAAINFPGALNAIFIMMVFVISIGIFLAPMWGSLFISHGYEWTYFSLAIMTALIGLPLFLLALPYDTHIIHMGEEVEKNTNNNRRISRIPTAQPEYGPDAELDGEGFKRGLSSEKGLTKSSQSLVDDRQEERKLKLCKICCKPRILSHVITFFVVIYSQIYFVPILATRFQELGIKKSQLGLYFGIRPAAQLFATALCIFLLRVMKRPPLIFMAVILMIIGLILFGPSQVLHFPESIEAVSIGFLLLGLANGFSMMPILPEMIHYLVSNRILSRNKASDITASICDLVGGWGDIGAPIIGSLLDSQLGFRYTTDITLFLSIVAAMIYGVLGNGARSLCSLCKRAEAEDYGQGSQRNLVGGRTKADSVVITKIHMQRDRKRKLAELRGN